jgi:tetratricopeptide (TPR) repeat protein/transcriptional regulator with XRE-family HTH domain
MPNFEDSDSLAAVLRKYMKLVGVGTSRLAQLSGVTEPTIKHWWNGRVRHTRDWQNLVRVAAALKLDAEAASTLLLAAGQPSIPYLLDHVLDPADQALLASWATSTSPTNQAPAQPVDLADALQQLRALPIDRLPEPRPMPVGSRIILSRNPLFVGREGDLCALAAAIKAGTTTAISHTGIAAATGLGGIGKTQLASEFVHRYGQYFAGGVFWLSFADGKTIPGEIAACGGGGGMNLRPDYHTLPLEEQVHLVRAAWQQPIPRLLIFDNCEDETLLDEWRPPTGGCRILITSRRSQWDLVLNVQTLSIDVLRREDSIALLRKHRPDLMPDDPILDAIAAEVGDLPLALHLAGSYLAKYRDAMTPEAYLLALRSPPSLSHPSLREGGLSPTRHEQHVGRTFDLSYQRLDVRHPTDGLALRIVARVAAFAPGEPIPRDLLVRTFATEQSDAYSPFLIEDALVRLSELGLLERQEHQSFRLHRLLVAFVDMKAPDPTARTAVERAVLDRTRQCNDDKLVMPVLPWQQHLRSIVDHARLRGDEQGADLTYALGNHLWLVGNSVAARASFEHALNMYEHLLGESHRKAINTLEWLATMDQIQGAFDQALTRFSRVLSLRQQGGVDHLGVAATHINLGGVLRVQSDFGGAEQHLRTSLAIYQQRVGMEHSGTAEALNLLGYVWCDLAHYRRALRYFKLALAIRQQVLTPMHIWTAQTVHNIGVVNYLLGQYDLADAYYQQALAMRIEAVGEQHYDIAESLCYLGWLRYDQAHDDEAHTLFVQGLDVHEALAGEDPGTKKRILDGLGCLAHRQGDAHTAWSYFERSLAISEANVGADHIDAATTLDYIGMLLLSQQRYTEARRSLERSLTIRTRTFGTTHPDVAQSFYHLGILRQTEGDQAYARSAYQQAKIVFEQRLGRQHPRTKAVQTRWAALDGHS